jgi:hypothetical protein
VDSASTSGPDSSARAGAGTRRDEERTAIPLLRSPGRGARDGAGRGVTRFGRFMARSSRRVATSGSTTPRPSRPSHETQTIASTVAATGGANHHRICTGPG